MTTNSFEEHLKLLPPYFAQYLIACTYQFHQAQTLE